MVPCLSSFHPRTLQQVNNTTMAVLIMMVARPGAIKLALSTTKLLQTLTNHVGLCGLLLGTVAGAGVITTVSLV